MESIDLLRQRTSHNFTIYKYNMLRHRIGYRIGMTAIGATGCS